MPARRRMREKPFDIRERSYLFARDVIAFARARSDSCDFVMRRLLLQLVGAAGSVGANLAEAADAQSKPDFVSKNCIALKEAREAKFWLSLIRDGTPQQPTAPVTALIDEADALRRILAAIVLTSKRTPTRGERKRG